MVLCIYMQNKLSIYGVGFILFSLTAVGYFFINTNQNEQKNTSDNIKLTEKTNTERPFILITFGDSLTAGYAVPLEESYPSLLEKELQKIYPTVNVINMGVSGETTSGGIERVSFVLAQKPSLVLLGIGANDMLRASSPALTKANLKIIIEEFKKQNIPLLLLGIQSVSSNGPLYNKEFNAIYSDLAKEYSLPLVPLFLDGIVLSPSFNTSDGIHPNKLGYEYIVKNNILPVLLPILKDMLR